jgi:hypothetical protein
MACYNMQLRMMRKTFSFLLASLVAAWALVGCKEKPVTTPGDLENPTIVMTSPVELPQGQYIPITSSDSFQVDIAFADDKELRDWEVTIRFVPALNYLRTNSAAWKETWYGDLDGVSGGVNFQEFVIYDPTAGPYEFTVTVTDMAGKTAQKKTYFFVKNDIDLYGPTITFMNPDTANIDTVAIGDPIHIVAQVQEAPLNTVKDAYLRVRDKLTKATLEGSEIRWDTIYINTLQIDTTINVPAGAVPGNYNIELYGNDAIYNVTYGKCEIYIKPN